jgi:flagellar hook-length control protein FliK
VQTTNSADTIAVAPAPVPLSTPAPAQTDQDGSEQQVGLAAETGLQLKSLNANAPKTVSGKQAEDGKQAAAGNPVETDLGADEIANGSQQPKTGLVQQAQADKPQFAVSENDKNNDKNHIAEARGEPAANGHHGNADNPVTMTADSGSTAPKIVADTGTQSTVQTTAAQADSNAAAPAVPISQPGPQAAPIPLAGVAMEIAGKALAGKNRFEIRLDPPELGRIEVRLDVDKDGNVTSRMTVDRADTLDLLRRDATGLERALQDAGLKTADNSLQFSLRDQSMGQQQTSAGPDAAQMIVTDETQSPIDVIPQNYGRLAGTGGGLDIRV